MRSADGRAAGVQAPALLIAVLSDIQPAVLLADAQPAVVCPPDARPAPGLTLVVPDAEFPPLVILPQPLRRRDLRTAARAR